jgi:hypothetical protein
MVVNVLEVAKSGLELKLDGECNVNPISNLLKFSCCFVPRFYNLFNCVYFVSMYSYNSFDHRAYTNLQKLLPSIGQLNALQELVLSWCFNMKELHSSIGQLNAL